MAAAAAFMLFGCDTVAGTANTARPAAAASAQAVEAVAKAALPVTGSGQDYDRLIAAAAQAGATRVLLGESTHGTHEYYRERARITHRLIQERGFNAVAIEGDWSPTDRVNRYVRGLGKDRSADQALRGYTRFPQWMWRNSDFRNFVEQLRAHNMALPPNQRVGVYGADVYDLFEAADAVVGRLASIDRAAARRAKAHYRCLSGFNRNLYTYGSAAQVPGVSCARDVLAVLDDVRRLPVPAGADAAESHFGVLRAAASAVAAEEYFRTIYAKGDAWNIRDSRMADNIDAIAAHAARLTGREGRVVVWSHNSHTGDARATVAANKGEHNIGQLMKQRHGERAMLVGFLTHSGTVRAASEWDQPSRVFDLKPGLEQSDAGLFHRTGLSQFMLLLDRNPELEAHLNTPMLQRAVGVIYVPYAEIPSHYGPARLAAQFDATIYFDRTKAVQPL